MWDVIIKLFDSTDKVSLLISSIATFIAAISTIVANNIPYFCRKYK